ncbi:MAG TPA: hypothetical protein VHJ59_05965 [Nitrososphaera sp.]|nr:hypothetical protein [Nitrososphaera sp.]
MHEREAKLEKYNRPKGERKEESILLKRASGNQRSTSMVDREIKSLRGHESSSELFCSAVIYHEKHIDLVVCEMARSGVRPMKCRK